MVFGSFLLENLISFAKKLNIKVITLEVNECNLSAIKLYNKFNFNKVGVRKKYYDGKNDAIIMTCNVI
jgi:ribosomal protein S18 acetylase RimI-like enzyme